MSIGEVLSGYLSQVHSSRDVKIDMVKQMHYKFRYDLFSSWIILIMPAPKSIAYDEYAVDIEQTYKH